MQVNMLKKKQAAGNVFALISRDLNSDCEAAKLLDAIPAGIAIIKNGRFDYINQHLLKLLNLKKINAQLGRPVWETAVAEDISLVRSQYLDLEKNLRERKNYTYRAKAEIGGDVFLEVSSNAIEFNENIIELANIVNVTDKVLNESENRYNAILDGIEDGYGEIDLTGKVTFCNQSFHQIYGYHKFELIGLDYRSYLDPETAKEVFRAYNHVYKTGISNKAFAYEIICKDGGRRIIENSISLKKSSEGEPVGFRSVVRDITDRKQAEDERFMHRTRLIAIFSSVMDAIVTVDSDMKVIEANKAAGRICGIDHTITKEYDFMNSYNGCNKCCVSLLRQTMDRKVSIQGYRIECRADKVSVLNCSPLKDVNNRSLGAVMVIRDITRIYELEELEKEFKKRHKFQNIIGKSAGMQAVYSIVEDIANINTTILITGESGTGKELVAKAIHNTGNRRNEPFVAVNCAALTETLLESELFGHVKGAFTGAVKDRDGRFMIADGGTILLDEIGDISHNIQVKLLRVLQEKQFERVGDATPTKVDVRIIAATNRNLEELILQQRFREDLYYRLKVMEIKLPSLRERREDIPLLVDHFLGVFNKQYGKQIQHVSNEILNVFMSYHWPGNVRELEHAMERIYVLCRGENIDFAHLPPEIERTPIKRRDGDTNDAIDEVEQLSSALKQTDWNKAKTARLLRVDRTTVYRRIKKYKLTKSIQ